MAQRNKGCGEVRLSEVVKPRDRCTVLIDPGIELDCPERRKRNLKARYIVKRESKKGKPIGQPIPGDAAERQELVKTRAEPAIAKRTIEIVWNPPDPATRNQ
jgi:hypothetical protein